MQKKEFASGETLRRVVFALLFCGCMAFFKTCSKDKPAADIPKKARTDTIQNIDSDF
jgi:hypothetical protein